MTSPVAAFSSSSSPSGGYRPPPRTSDLRDPGSPRIPAGIVAVTASLSVRFLMRFFETNRLTPFAIYCTTAGAALTIGVLAT